MLSHLKLIFLLDCDFGPIKKRAFSILNVAQIHTLFSYFSKTEVFLSNRGA